VGSTYAEIADAPLRAPPADAELSWGFRTVLGTERAAGAVAARYVDQEVDGSIAPK
jgi:hypothetical protein